MSITDGILMVLELMALFLIRPLLQKRWIPGVQECERKALIEFPERRFGVNASIITPFLIAALLLRLTWLALVNVALLSLIGLSVWGTHMYRVKTDDGWTLNEPAWRKRLRK